MQAGCATHIFIKEGDGGGRADARHDVITSVYISIRQHTCQHTHLFKEGDGGGRADARHDVFALRVEQKFAVELILAGRRVAREEHARA